MICAQRFKASSAVFEDDERILGPFESSPFFLEDPDEVEPTHRVGVGGLWIRVVNQDVPSAFEVDRLRSFRRRDPE